MNSKRPLGPPSSKENSGTRQILTSLLANEAYMAIKPACLPINLTRPTPYSAAFASTSADLIALVAS